MGVIVGHIFQIFTVGYGLFKICPHRVALSVRSGITNVKFIKASNK